MVHWKKRKILPNLKSYLESNIEIDQSIPQTVPFFLPLCIHLSYLIVTFTLRLAVIPIKALMSLGLVALYHLSFTMIWGGGGLGHSEHQASGAQWL